MAAAAAAGADAAGPNGGDARGRRRRRAKRKQSPPPTRTSTATRNLHTPTNTHVLQALPRKKRHEPATTDTSVLFTATSTTRILRHTASKQTQTLILRKAYGNRMHRTKKNQRTCPILAARAAPNGRVAATRRR